MIGFETPEGIRYLSDARLKASGITEKPLSDIELPDVRFATNGDREAVPYAVFGDPSARNVVLNGATYLTQLRSPHFLLRLAAHQAALGDDYCVVGAQTFEPGAFNGQERQKLSKGDYGPLSERGLRVVDALHLGSNQKLLAYGYSLQGDVSAQIAHDLLRNPNRGVANLAGVGVVEAARTTGLGAKDALDRFNASGKDLLRNILESNTPALNQAWNVGRDTRGVVFDGRVARGAAGYILRDLRDNAAFIRGSGTDLTVTQLGEVIGSRSAPHVFLGREERSTVFPQTAVMDLRDINLNGVTLNIGPGDHSSDDNLPYSAGRVLHFALSVSSAK